MNKSNSNFVLCVFIILVLTSNSVSGNQISGFSGSISTDTIEQGSTVMFSGSIHNLYTSNIYMYSMNVSFMENFGKSKVYNITKSYGVNGEVLFSNNTFTDIIESKINYIPGKYNISIYFEYGASNGLFPDEWNSTYALANKTVEVTGTTQSIKIARGFVIVLGIITGFVIILFIYNKVTKK